MTKNEYIRKLFNNNIKGGFAVVMCLETFNRELKSWTTSFDDKEYSEYVYSKLMNNTKREMLGSLRAFYFASILSFEKYSHLYDITESKVTKLLKERNAY